MGAKFSSNIHHKQAVTFLYNITRYFAKKNGRIFDITSFIPTYKERESKLKTKTYLTLNPKKRIVFDACRVIKVLMGISELKIDNRNKAFCHGETFKKIAKVYESEEWISLREYMISVICKKILFDNSERQLLIRKRLGRVYNPSKISRRDGIIAVIKHCQCLVMRVNAFI